MSRGFDKAVLEQASRAQRGALDVGISVWVSASAGTGKTEVLTRRLMALLLTDSELKAKEIVALTFTRAGAAEMASRLPERLAEWAKLEEEALAAAVHEQLGLVEVPGLTARVRGLADEVLREGPVVTTIHGLGQMLLGSFPLEAGVPMGFGVLEDGERARMLLEIQHGLLVKGGALSEHLAVLLDELGDHGWRELTDIIVRDWRKLEHVMGAGDVREVLARVDAALELKGGEEWVLGPMVPNTAEIAALKVVAVGLPGKGAAEILAATGALREKLWSAFLLTDKGTARARLLTKAEVGTVGEGVLDVLNEAKGRVEEQVRLRRLLRGRRLTEALLYWGAAVKTGYAAYKREMGMLDYDDLLNGLERLLARAQEGLAEWVWYVLDRKFRHLVVDEAQDNNPQQDRIVRMLMRNLLSGESDGRRRTMMAVGDVKQSIFRFQGAVPELFLRLHDEMGLWAGGDFKAVDILHSFRSGAHVLGAVDQVFADAELAREVTGREGDWPVHIPVASGRASRVEVWPLVAEGEKVEVAPWALPQERFAAMADGADVVCFRQLGSWLQEQVRRGVVMPSTGTSLRFEDVMVVVQKNRVAALAAGIFRQMGIPSVVGAGVVSQAVSDVMALCRAVFNVRDHVALATVLKGLCGWDDARLLTLAERAGDEGWYAALEGDDKVWLERLRREVPLAVVMEGMRLAGGTWEAFEPLLGWAEECRFMAELVARMEHDDLPAAAGGSGVRILTVHGSKGLQAPLVILPDTMARMGDVQDKVLWGEDTVLVKTRKGISALEDRLLDEESARRRADSLRGLYVAMTRASDWLVLCGWGKPGNRDSWYSLMADVARDDTAWRTEEDRRVRGDVFEVFLSDTRPAPPKTPPAWLESNVLSPLVGCDAEC